MDSHLGPRTYAPRALRQFEVTVRGVFTGEQRQFVVTARDAYHAAAQVKQLAGRDLLVRIAYA